MLSAAQAAAVEACKLKGASGRRAWNGSVVAPGSCVRLCPAVKRVQVNKQATNHCGRSFTNSRTNNHNKYYKYYYSISRVRRSSSNCRKNLCVASATSSNNATESYAERATEAHNYGYDVLTYAAGLRLRDVDSNACANGQRPVAQIRSLHTYPVKGLAAVDLEKAVLRERRGFLHDRRWAFLQVWKLWCPEGSSARLTNLPVHRRREMFIDMCDLVARQLKSV